MVNNNFDARALLAPFFGHDRRVLHIMTQTVVDAKQSAEAVAQSLGATDALDQATVITLSPNKAFANERVLLLGRGLKGTVTASNFNMEVSSDIPLVEGGFNLALTVTGHSNVILPITGQLATTGNIETLERKTLASPKLSGLINAADDTAAAGAGVSVGSAYRNGSILMVRVT